EDEIRKRSRELSFRYHPDQNGGSDAYKRQFDAVQEARRELLDPERRSALQKRILFAAWLRFKADYDAPSTLQMTTKAPVSFDDF
ncbi:DnaJ domain-containing protein, partial [Acinetobacter baumannii]